MQSEFAVYSLQWWRRL